MKFFLSPNHHQALNVGVGKMKEMCMWGKGSKEWEGN